jgi:hypothetical protein
MFVFLFTFLSVCLRAWTRGWKLGHVNRSQEKSENRYRIRKTLTIQVSWVFSVSLSVILDAKTSAKSVVYLVLGYAFCFQPASGFTSCNTFAKNKTNKNTIFFSIACQLGRLWFSKKICFLTNKEKNFEATKTCMLRGLISCDHKKTNEAKNAMIAYWFAQRES